MEAPLFTFTMKAKAKSSALHFLKKEMDDLRAELPVIKTFFEKERAVPPTSTATRGKNKSTVNM